MSQKFPSAISSGETSQELRSGASGTSGMDGASLGGIQRCCEAGAVAVARLFGPQVLLLNP